MTWHYTLLAVTYVCSGHFERQEVGHADQPEHLPLDRTDAAPVLVVNQLRRDPADGPPSGHQLAAACGQDVLDPVTVRAIGQGKKIAVPAGNTLTGVW